MPDPVGLMPDYGLGQFSIPGYGDLARSIPPPETVVPTPVTAPAPTPQRTILPLRPAAPTPFSSLEAGLPAMPAPPRKIPVPEPPAPEYTDPLKAAGKPMTLLALIASTFVRNPAVAAGNALASAMEAQKKGDRVRYAEAYQHYVQQMAKVAAEQRQENEEYQAAFNNRKMTLDERIATMRMIASKRHDSLMLQALTGQGGPAAGGNPSSDAGALLDARFKLGKPITEAEMIYAGAREKMKAHPELSFVDAVAQTKREFETGKAEAKVAAKPFTLTQERARDVEARTKRIMVENPGIDEDTARSRALEQVQLAQKAPAGAGWATLDPTVQAVASAFPAAREELANSTFKLSPQRQGQLMTGLKVVRENDRVARYIAENPDAVGVLPVIYNRYHATLVSQPTISFASPQEAAAIAAKVADDQANDLRALGGKFTLPDGRILTPGLAEKAAILNKMLIQTGLTDAAQMSASGRGGTIYLDKLMTERIYNQRTNPYTLINFLADRSKPAVDNWRDFNSNIDLASPNAPEQFRSHLLAPGGIESFLGSAYSQGAGPPGSKFIGMTPEGKPVYELPDGSRMVPK